MRLLSLLIKRELQENLTSSRYVLTSILCVVLCVTSIILMSQDYANRIERLSLSQHTYGRNTIAKPPQPLSLIAKGIEEVIGRATLPQPPDHQPVAHFFNYYGEEHHLFDLFTTPDFVYIVSVVLSALAIFLSFDAICGEKETHTLSLLLSNSLPRSTLLLAKWLGGYASFLISFSPALLLMLIFMTVFSGVPLEAEHWVRLMVMIGLSLVYLSVFFTLGLLISTLTHRSAASFILALFIWAIWALGVPRVGILAARAMNPVYDEQVLRLEKQRVVSGDELTASNREKLWKMNDTYIATVDRQTQMGQHLSRMSPLASYLYASTTLTQTGLSDYKDYWMQLDRWNRERIRRGEGGDATEFVAQHYRPLSLERSLSEIGIDGGLLLLWNVLLFLCAHTAFLRYDVR